MPDSHHSYQRNPPLGAAWFTPRVAARLYNIERHLINERIHRHGNDYNCTYNLMVCDIACEKALSIVEQESGLTGWEENGVIFYPGLGGKVPSAPDEPVFKGYHHWWIRLEDGTLVDIATSQFGERGPIVVPAGHPLQRRYLGGARIDYQQGEVVDYPWDFSHWEINY